MNGLNRLKFEDSFDDSDSPLIDENRLQSVFTPNNHQLSPVDNNSYSTQSNRIENGPDLLVVSLIEAVCTLAEPDEEKQKKLFAIMFDRLVQLGFVSPISFSEDLGAVRAKLRSGLSLLLIQSRLSIAEPSALIDQSTVAIQKPRHAIVGFDDCPIRLSRYQTDFVESETLGKGGFGRVYKAVNKLDGVAYAVKKISFSSAADSGMCIKVLREVKLLAQLNHPNIVRYYQAWLETDDCVASAKLCGHRNSSMNESRSNSDSQEDSQTKDVDIPPLLRRTLSSPQISFRDDSCGQHQEILEVLSNDSSRPCAKRRSNRTTSDHLSDNMYKSFLKNRKTTSRKRSSFRSLSTECLKSLNEDVSGEISSVPQSWSKEARDSVKPLSPFSRKLNLYVQMELGNFTLRDWISRRNLSTTGKTVYACVDGAQNRHILKQLVQGLEYLHSRGVIHRDLKPNNVFIRQEDFGVLIGDFGLACLSMPAYKTSQSESLDENKRHVETSPNNLANLHSCGVGTHTYSAPEQLRSNLYDFKVDIYSLGIIMFELYQPMNTHMERISAILELRRGKIDSLFEVQWPIEQLVLRNLVDHRPDKRPSARQLLLLFDTAQEEIISGLKETIAAKDEEIKRLRTLMKLEHGD